MGGQCCSAHDNDSTLYSPKDDSAECLSQAHKGCVTGLQITKGGKRLVTASQDNTIKIWNHRTGKLIKSFLEEAPITAFVLSNDGGHFAVAVQSRVSYWSIQYEMMIGTFSGHRDMVLCVDIASDDSFILSGSKDKTLKTYDTKSGKCLKTFTGHPWSVTSCCLSWDDEHIVSCAASSLRLWHVPSGTCLRTLNGHSERIQQCIFSKNAALVISVSYDHTIRVWDSETGKNKSVFECDTNQVLKCCHLINNDSSVLVGGHELLTCFNVETGSFQCSTPQSGYVQNIAMTRDGMIFAGSERGTVDVVKLKETGGVFELTHCQYETILGQLVESPKFHRVESDPS